MPWAPEPAASFMSLGEQQAALLAALTGRSPVPPGFDAARVLASAEMLFCKRARSVAQAWPSLAQALSSDFNGRFTAYARAIALPASGGPAADGRLFVHWLKANGEPLTDLVRAQALAMDLRFKRKQQGYTLRRWPSVRAVRLPDAQCWLIGVRLPGLNWERHMRIGLPHPWPRGSRSTK